MNTANALLLPGVSLITGSARFAECLRRVWRGACTLLLSLSSVLADPSWTQLSPMPETRSLRCLAYANGTYYAAGIAGAFLSSQDSVTWLDQSIGYTNHILAATTGNGLVVLGGYDHFLISSNGLNWEQVTNVATDSSGSLGFGNGRFINLGLAGSISSSTNGRNWIIHRQVGGQEQFQAFGYAPGAFVGLSGLGIWFSSNGTSWSKVSTIAADAIVYANGRFTAGDSNGHLYQSPDGRNWLQTSSILPGAISALLNDGPQYLALVNGLSFYSSIDSTNWTPMTVPVSIVGERTAMYANGRYVIAGDAGGLLSGSSIAALDSVNPGIGEPLVDVAAGATNYVAVGIRSVFLSDNGLTWKRLPPSPSRDMHFIRYINGTYFAGAENGVFFESTNGVDWQEGSLPNLVTLNSLTTDGKVEVLVGGVGAVLYSTNGTNWKMGTGQWTGGDITYNDITWANGTWVCVGYGRLITSTNGITWQKIFIDTSWLLTGVNFAQNQFVAVGLNGIVLTSPDGFVWTHQPAPTTNHLTHVTFFDDRLLATVQPKLPSPKSLPGVLASTNGTDWVQSLVVPPAVGLTSITQDGRIALAVGSAGYIYRLGDVQRPDVALQSNGGALQYVVHGQAGVNFALETSEDLRNWAPAAVILNATETVQFQQLPVLGATKQFYRATVK